MSGRDSLEVLMAELKPFPLSLGIHSDYQDISQAMLPDSLINCECLCIHMYMITWIDNINFSVRLVATHGLTPDIAME